MYVCNCNGIRECELRRAALRAAGDAEAVYASLGKRPNCGQCLDDADEIIQQERRLALIPFAA